MDCLRRRCGVVRLYLSLSPSVPTRLDGPSVAHIFMAVSVWATIFVSEGVFLSLSACISSSPSRCCACLYLSVSPSVLYPCLCLFPLYLRSCLSLCLCLHPFLFVVSLPATVCLPSCVSLCVSGSVAVSVSGSVSAPVSVSVYFSVSLSMSVSMSVSVSVCLHVSDPVSFLHVCVCVSLSAPVSVHIPFACVCVFASRRLFASLPLSPCASRSFQRTLDWIEVREPDGARMQRLHRLGLHLHRRRHTVGCGRRRRLWKALARRFTCGDTRAPPRSWPSGKRLHCRSPRSIGDTAPDHWQHDSRALLLSKCTSPVPR